MTTAIGLQPDAAHLKRGRLRDYGAQFDRTPTGRYNAITDVPGVQVGHATVNYGEGDLVVGKGPARTGVTAILPNAGNIFQQRVIGSGFVLNGAGEVAGLTQIREWGIIETPILLTNTLSVGPVSAATVRYMVEQYPEIGSEADVIIPAVGECDDSWLNDIAGRHVQQEHVFEAIQNAKSGPVEEGSVGGGTGMLCCDFKGGIGTASRKVPSHQGGYVVGALVMSNFGVIQDLRVDGIPVGRMLERRFAHYEKRTENYGSIIVVIGTNAPLLPHQIERLCKRAALGIGRVGSCAAHGSGEIIVGFSTANTSPRDTTKRIYRMKVLLDRAIDPLYRAAIHATEEAILNSMTAAETMVGHSGHTAPALPLEPVIQLLHEQDRRINLELEREPVP